MSIYYTNQQILTKLLFLLPIFVLLSITLQGRSSGDDLIKDVSSAPICLHNASNDWNGQYSQRFALQGRSGLKWKLIAAYNLYNPTSQAPPFSPIPLNVGVNGDTLTEQSVGNGMSQYSIIGKFEQGKPIYMLFQSDQGDVFEIQYSALNYDEIGIIGKNSVCINDTATYTVPFHTNGYHFSITGASILSSNSDSSRVTVHWNSSPGLHTIRFILKGTHCSSPATLRIAVGSQSNAIACKQTVNISLEHTCHLEITPSMISAHRLNLDDPFVVELYISGTGKTSSVVSSSLIGKVVNARLKEGCGGNYCWSNLVIEDKKSPELWCPDTVRVNCGAYTAGNYAFALDNCNTQVSTFLLDSITIIKNCDPNLVERIEKIYVAINKSGNKSSPCKVVIDKYRIKLDEVIFPKNILTADALDCSEFLKDEHGGPHPILTGYPTYRGRQLNSLMLPNCQTVIYYHDKIKTHSGCSKQIERTWTIAEWWCDQYLISESKQTIELKDRTAPNFTCPTMPSQISLTHSCSSVIELPKIVDAVDNCDTTLHFHISVGQQIIHTNGGTVELEFGHYDILYRLSDDCGNSNSCVVHVNVKETTAPVMVCHKNVVVSLSNTDETRVFATSVDDGSHDNCNLDSFAIRRVEPAVCDSLNLFRNYMVVCCKEAGDSIMVELKAWDTNQNTNSCMTFIKIQDKTPPAIQCPMDTIVSCTLDLQNEDLLKFGYATTSDNCGAIITESITDKLDQCRIGYIQRVFTASDGFNESRCTTYIYQQNDQPGIKVTWPKDYSITGACSPIDLQPDSLPSLYGRPVVNEGICNLAADNYEDKYFSFNDGNGSCFKIVRKWTVTDYCAMADTNYRPMIHEQIIKVSNTVDPTLVLDVQSKSCTSESDCQQGEIKLVAYGNDDCTPSEMLQWKISIDLHHHGIHESDAELRGKGDTLNASGTYPVGVHQVIFILEDKCGNQVSSVHEFEIVNCKAPTPVCLSNFSLTLTDMTLDGQPIKMACINASSLNKSSSHACDLPLTYSFSPSTLDTTLCFTCNDIGEKNIKLYVTDTNGNQAYCDIEAEIQNNSGTTVTLEGPSQACAGNFTTLSVITTAFESITWSTGASTPMITVNPTITTTYSVTVSTEDGCRIVLSKTLTVEPNVADIIGDKDICPMESSTLSVAIPGTYLWSNGSTSNAITITPSVSTIYMVTVTSANGCPSTGTAQIMVNPSPTFNLNAASPICSGVNSVISVSNNPQGSSIMWSTGETNFFIPIKPTETTNYSVTVTSDKGCSSFKEVTIAVNPSPIASISGDNMICDGESTTLTASGGPVYFWNIANIQNPTITVNPNSNSVYTVTVTNAFGCRDVESIQIFVHPIPMAQIIGNLEICQGESTSLTALGGSVGSTYQWQPTGETTLSISVAPQMTTSYQVMVTTAQGCSSNKSATVTVKNCLNRKAVINGTISDALGGYLSQFPVDLIGKNAYHTISDEEGNYTFNSIPILEDIELAPASNENLMQGVSTLDMIHIQRHILGIDILENSFHLIAADINGDNKISAQDLVILRKNILGTMHGFGNNKSWRVVPSDFKFPNPKNPFESGFPESTILLPFFQDTTINFIGIKTGDVDASIITNKNGHSNSECTLLLGEIKSRDNLSEIVVTSSGKMTIDGGQFELILENATIIEVTSTSFNEDEYHYNINGGKLKIIFYPKHPRELIDEKLFTIKIKKTFPLDDPIAFSLDNSEMYPEIYTHMNARQIVFERTETQAAYDILTRIIPNPWKDKSAIKFTLPEATNLDFIIYNVQGSPIWYEKINGISGENEIPLSRNKIPSNGTFHFVINSQTFKTSGKFIIMD